MGDNTNIILQLEKVIKSRMNDDSQKSYVALLNQKGLNEILKKIGEEAAEVIIAGKDKNRNDIINESCDLIFHLMVFLSNQNISFKNIESELSKRFDVSGLEEKANRSS